MTRPEAPAAAPIAAILAGGRGTRLGGIDKAFIPWAGEPLILRVARRLRPHCRALTVVANGHLGRFEALGFDAVADRADPVLRGARLGLVTAFGLLEGCDADTGLLTVPTDLPDLPFDLVRRLGSALGIAGRGTGAAAAYAVGGGRLQPLVALWTRAGAAGALARLAADPDASVAALHQAIGSVPVDFAADPQDPFRNINRPEDLPPARG